MSVIPTKEMIENKRERAKNEIHNLNISDEWKDEFQLFYSTRGWRSLLTEKWKNQIENISNVNSETVKEFMQLKLTGINWIEFMAIELHNEVIRRKAMSIFLEKGVGKGKDEVLALSLSPENESQESRN
jgi:hypothetical protein